MHLERCDQILTPSSGPKIMTGRWKIALGVNYIRSYKPPQPPTLRLMRPEAGHSVAAWDYVEVVGRFGVAAGLVLGLVPDPEAGPGLAVGHGAVLETVLRRHEHRGSCLGNSGPGSADPDHLGGPAGVACS
jgi:hypothetical protein